LTNIRKYDECTSKILKVRIFAGLGFLESDKNRIMDNII